MERVVIVKKENDEEEVEEAVRIASSLPEGSPFSSSLTSPSQGVRPMEGLHDAGPPPFLTKTYEMVEDPSTDTIVSWSTARNSFIVWDSHRLSTLLLPKYFKHGNFSSFVRQLNTYGFRKIDPDRWEFANEGFLGGQKHLLKTIKRRRNVSQGGQNRGQEGPCVELGHYGLEGEIERLKRDCGVLMAEVIRLRQQQQNSKQQVMSMKDRLQSSEQKQQQLMTFLAKALMNPSFVEGLMKQRQFLQGIQSGRKRRLTACSSEENLQEEVFSAAMGVMPIEDELGMGDPDFETLFTSALDDESSSDIKEELKEGAFRPSSSSGNTANTNDMDDIDWEELLNERLVGSEEAKELSVFEEDVQVGELAEKPNVEWTDDLQYLADRMGF